MVYMYIDAEYVALSKCIRYVEHLPEHTQDTGNDTPKGETNERAYLAAKSHGCSLFSNLKEQDSGFLIHLCILVCIVL